MFYFLFSLVVLGLLVLLVTGVVGYYRDRNSDWRKWYKEQSKVLREAETSLRNIANGESANPILEAQVGLASITNYYERKEITS